MSPLCFFRWKNAWLYQLIIKTTVSATSLGRTGLLMSCCLDTSLFSNQEKASGQFNAQLKLNHLPLFSSGALS